MKRRRAKSHATSHERWLVSYADFMTLLFALFVVLFASSHHDNQTIRRVSSSVKNGFEQMSTLSQVDTTTNPPYKITSTPTPPSKTVIDVIALQAQLKDALGKEIEQQQVGLKTTPEGFVISLHELGFFESGQAHLLTGASDTIKRIAGVLNHYGLDMRIEGHSDNVPIHNGAFASNWDLSIARATTVAMMLLDDAGFDPQRMSIAGYGQYHPAASNDTSEGRRANRRVDIVVVAVTARPTNP
jgi:chemotaxis protein MotB